MVILVAIYVALQLVSYAAVWVQEGPDKALAILLDTLSPFGTSTAPSQWPDFLGKKCSGKTKTETVTSTRKFFWIFTYSFIETRSYCLNADKPSGSTI